ncbi:MAG: hypothetical protein H6745_18455 [Deltaproteobacteria bacterium]|nr:hypothetical protein [Deltaproteobacteria bacterium]
MNRLLRTGLLPALLLLSSVAAPSGAARAEECGNVTTLGTCLDSKTLVWCDAGTLRTQVCPEGEICVADDRFQGGYGCIATQYTSCGAITAAGECAADDRVLLWCDVSRVRARECGIGLTCAWVEADGGYDCVPVATQPDPDAGNGGDADAAGGDDTAESDASDGSGGDDAASDAVGSDASLLADSGPVPSVESGGAGPAESYTAAGGAGCAGGGPRGAPWLVVAAVAAWLARRRRARIA